MVTISTQEYMDLIHKASVNELMLNRLLSFESRLNNMNDEYYKMDRRLHDLESKAKEK